MQIATLKSGILQIGHFCCHGLTKYSLSARIYLTLKGGFVMGRKHTAVRNEITEGVIWKQLLFFFFPIMLGSLFQQLYNMADAMIVGNFVGKEALAAVGGTTSVLINLLVGFFVGVASGATVVISQFYGAGEDEHVKKSVHTAVMLAIVGGLILMLAGIITARPLLELMQTPEEIMGYSVTYIRIYFLGMVPSAIYNIGTGILRAVGDSKRPLYFLMTACLINIILDLLFVVVFKWGVVGAGIATITSQAVSAVLVCLVLLRSDGSYKVNIREIRFDGQILPKIIRIGIPAGMQSVMYNAANIVVQTSINTFGTNTVAAWTVFEKMDGIFWMVLAAFGVAVTTFVGQNFGAQKYERVHKSVRVSLAMCMGIAIVLSGVLILLAGYIFRLFTPDANVVDEGVFMVRFLMPFYFTYVCTEILSGAIRGMGNAFVPMIITCVGVCVMRIAWIAFVVPVWHDTRAVMLCFPLTWIITSVAFIIYYRRIKV